MHNADLPLRHVPVDSFLLLGFDSLLDPTIALHEFCEPVRILELHPGRDFNEGAFARSGGVIIHALGFDVPTGREISVELEGRKGDRVLVRFPDDRHMVKGVNLPGRPFSSPEPGNEPLARRLVWADGWKIEYGS